MKIRGYKITSIPMPSPEGPVSIEETIVEDKGVDERIVVLAQDGCYKFCAVNYRGELDLVKQFSADLVWSIEKFEKEETDSAGQGSSTEPSSS